MTERQWWSSHIKPRWHAPEAGMIAWKVEDKFNGGMPDVDVCFNGVCAKIELKYEAAWPVRPNTPLWFSTVGKDKKKSIVTEGQFNHLNQWSRAGGLSLVLIGIGKEWLILEAGTFLNEPKDKNELLDLAQAYSGTYCPELKGYNSLSAVPTYIKENYV